MSYSRLEINRRFPRWNCNQYSDGEWCGYEYYDQFEGKDSNPNKKPDFNPLVKAVFDTRQGPFDIYTLGPVLHISRGFMISTKMKSILPDYKLSEYVIFDNIKYTFKGQMRDDLSFIYFYKDFSTFVDYRNSVFWAVKSDFRRIDGKIREADVIDKNIQILSQQDCLNKIEFYAKEKLRIKRQEICCPEAMKYDIFSIIKGPTEWGVYVSEKLRQRFRQEKIKGVNYASNMFFNFSCGS
ncbi:MAG: hypothetical protein DRI69_06700 [Bacteroidetes bacterium]|nr:MAG: hypothetical protein DRI69_06700 [Bacteroidota bacterium]